MELVASTALGAVAGFLAALTKGYFDSRAKVDDELHQARTDVYRELWRRTSVVPKWPRNEELTGADVRALSEWLRDWYFGVDASGERVPGGLYLSARARKRYEAAQDTLSAVAQRTSGPLDGPHDYTEVRTSLSRLRTAMTEDLLSRRGAPFRLR